MAGAGAGVEEGRPGGPGPPAGGGEEYCNI